jgi:hypothetical protein
MPIALLLSQEDSKMALVDHYFSQKDGKPPFPAHFTAKDYFRATGKYPPRQTPGYTSAAERTALPRAAAQTLIDRWNAEGDGWTYTLPPEGP